MNYKINTILKRLGIFNQLKLFKDKYFENPHHKIYRERLLEFYSQLINKNDFCFDIGASYGNRTETFLKLGAKVLAVEPQKNEFNYLKKKFGNKIILINKAVGSGCETKKMFLNEHSALSSLSEEWISKVKDTNRFINVRWDKIIDVEVVTLENLIENYGVPDFCKIDVEGYELEVLKGLSKPIKLISFEFTIPEFTDRAIDCINHLSKLGNIICNYSKGESLELGLNDWLYPDKFILNFKLFPSKNIIDGDIYVKFVDV